MDRCNCNEYRMTMDRSEKDALLNTPNGGLTFWEEMGQASKTDRFYGGLERLGSNPLTKGELQTKEFDRLRQFSALSRAPQIKFKDLQEVVDHKIRVNIMPFDVRFDFVKITSDTVLVPITVQIKFSLQGDRAIGTLWPCRPQCLRSPMLLSRGPSRACARPIADIGSSCSRSHWRS